MPEQDPQHYAAQTRTFPVKESDGDNYTPRKDRVKRSTRFSGLEKLVIRGCDPRYELQVTDSPLLAAERFGIRLNKEERKALMERPRALQMAINRVYWDVNSAGESLTPIEKLLIRGCNERHREIVGTDPIGAARQFKIKLTEIDSILLRDIREQDLSKAINAARKHLLKGTKCIIGHRLRLQKANRGRILSLCAVTGSRRAAVETRKYVQEVLQELFDLSKPLPSQSSETVFYFRGQSETSYFVRKRRLRRANRRAQRAFERRARRLSSRRAKNLSRSERRRTRTYSRPTEDGMPAGAPRRRKRRRFAPRSGEEQGRGRDGQGSARSGSRYNDGGGRSSSSRGGTGDSRGGRGRGGDGERGRGRGDGGRYGRQASANRDSNRGGGGGYGGGGGSSRRGHSRSNNSGGGGGGGRPQRSSHNRNSGGGGGGGTGNNRNRTNNRGQYGSGGGGGGDASRSRPRRRDGGGGGGRPNRDSRGGGGGGGGTGSSGGGNRSGRPRR